LFCPGGGPPCPPPPPAARRGYLSPTSYLLNIQAGFEIWQGGRGLGTKSFALSVEP
jgi:hypothetical protein